MDILNESNAKVDPNIGMNKFERLKSQIHNNINYQHIVLYTLFVALCCNCYKSNQNCQPPFVLLYMSRYYDKCNSVSNSHKSTSERDLLFLSYIVPHWCLLTCPHT